LTLSPEEAAVAVWQIGPMPGLTCQRDRFDLQDVAYLNCAYMGPLSHEVLEAARRGLERKARPWTIGPADFFDPVDEARELFAQLIGADADGVAILPSASYGIAIAAANLPMAAGSRIVALAEEFPSNVYAWMDLAERRRGELAAVRRPADLDWTSAVLAEVDERTAIVTLPHCHWTDGGVIDLTRIAERVREIGACLVLDATQSIGAMPLPIDDVRPDFLVTAGYKWLLGPYTSAFMWVAPRHRDGRPLEFSWMTRAHSDDFPRLVQYTEAYRAGARRYDGGETANFALVPALTAALRQTLEWGVGGVNDYAGALTDRLAAGVQELGLSILPSELRSRHLVGVRFAGEVAHSIADALESARVSVSVRGDAIRVSPHVYNDAADVDRLLEVLRATL
jgi:selenocysteine lyase/cysteine desulfurase